MSDPASILEETLQRTRIQQQLWDLPLIGNSDVPVALGISQTTWQQLKLDGTAPAGLMFGRRVLYRTRDLKLWLLSLEAKKNPSEEAGVLEESCV